MIDRRQFVGSLPASALCMSALAQSAHSAPPAEGQPLIASPPVVQHPRPRSFGVSIAVSGLATAWIEWGYAKDKLDHTAIAADHGLIAAHDRVLHVTVNHDQDLPTDRPVYYRFVVQALRYQNAYRLTRGEPDATDVYALRLPSATADTVRIVSINDTHEHTDTIRALHREIVKLNPDLLIWNGDTCNDFDEADAPQQILLNPAKDLTMGWATTRPLLYSNGNHDVRGQRAREIARILPGAPAPASRDLPYNAALRLGPLAIVTLDTGEDKPDHHPVFAGTAAYQPYREAQAAWLKESVAHNDIAAAPFKVAACHIPLRGLRDHNDGTTLKGYAYYCGFGAKLWLPTLTAAKFNAVLSGHMHAARLDEPTVAHPITQLVGGGPKLNNATLTVIDAKQHEDGAILDIRNLNLDGKVLQQKQWRA